MLHLPFRHALFAVFSLLFLAIGYLLIFWTDGWGALSGLLFVLALSGIVMLGLVSRERLFALIWPLLFLVLGLLVGHGVVLVADLLIGLAFSVLYLSIENRSRNFLRFPFFAVIKPALRNFLIFILLALAMGIYAGVSSQTIESGIRKSISGIEEVKLPGGGSIGFSTLLGGKKVSDFFENMLEKSREEVSKRQFLAPIIDFVAERRIRTECGDDLACAQRIRNEIASEFSRQTVSEDSAEEDAAIEQGLKGMLQQQVSRISGRNNLNLVAAIIFFLVLLPFSGVMAWILSPAPYLFYLLFRKAGFIKREERTVQQEFFK